MVDVNDDFSVASLKEIARVLDRKDKCMNKNELIKPLYYLSLKLIGEIFEIIIIKYTITIHF